MTTEKFVAIEFLGGPMDGDIRYYDEPGPAIIEFVTNKSAITKTLVPGLAYEKYPGSGNQTTCRYVRTSKGRMRHWPKKKKKPVEED
jgi:hypothetical protein